MNYASLLHRLPEELIGIFRKYEQEKKKEINAHWSLVFNKTCLSEKIWPKFNNCISKIQIYSLRSGRCTRYSKRPIHDPIA